MQEMRLLGDEICEHEFDVDGGISNWIRFLEGLRAIEMVRAETLDRSRRGEADIFLSFSFLRSCAPGRKKRVLRGVYPMGASPPGEHPRFLMYPGRSFGVLGSF